MIYREWLEKETQEKRYYHELLMSYMSHTEVTDQPQAKFGPEYMPVIHKGVTLSGLRRELERNSRAKLAGKEELTPSEQLFQSKLDEVSK